jgi:hypothetical protein
MTTEQSALAALVDGVALPSDAARDLWKRFSDYMGEHRGDFAGFAKSNGFVRIAPEYRNGKAVLVAYTKEPPRRGEGRPRRPEAPNVQSGQPKKKSRKR